MIIFIPIESSLIVQINYILIRLSFQIVEMCPQMIIYSLSFAYRLENGTIDYRNNAYGASDMAGEGASALMNAAG